MGCIRDFRFSKVLLSEPTVNHGATPCVKGMTAKGAYFAGDGAHVVLGLALRLYKAHFINMCLCAL